jgi:hypothetical protein
MKKLLGASGVGLLMLALPAISSAGTNLSLCSSYRSYDCTAGNPSVTINNTNNNNSNSNTGNNNDNNNSNNSNNDNSNNNTNNNTDPPDITTTDNNPSDGNPTCTSVPAPSASEIAGIGLAATMAYTWRRSRKLSRI